MTIAVAVRTESAVVFAADSKLTTRGIAGLDENGAPQWTEQTYDNATKVVQDRAGMLMAMSAGAANIGKLAATDFIATQEVPLAPNREDQDKQIAKLVEQMVEQKRSHWSKTQIPPASWPGPTLLIAAPAPGEPAPRVWRVRLDGEGSKIEDVLQEPFVRFEGAYDEVIALLFGYEHRVLFAIGQQLGIDREKVIETVQGLQVLRPIDQINFWAMPVQDAMDFAVFLATVQIEMDRFTPGTPACGGPIDVMVLQTAPEPKILSYPGKVLHHPRTAYTIGGQGGQP